MHGLNLMKEKYGRVLIIQTSVILCSILLDMLLTPVQSAKLSFSPLMVKVTELLQLLRNTDSLTGSG